MNDAYLQLLLGTKLWLKRRLARRTQAVLSRSFFELFFGKASV